LKKKNRRIFTFSCRWDNYIFKLALTTHLHRYLSEFDFRWSNRKLSDWERTKEALEMIEGKRLSYREPLAS